MFLAEKFFSFDPSILMCSSDANKKTEQKEKKQQKRLNIQSKTNVKLQQKQKNATKTNIQSKKNVKLLFRQQKERDG
jgi:hypothetical protein